MEFKIETLKVMFTISIFDEQAVDWNRLKQVGVGGSNVSMFD